MIEKLKNVVNKEKITSLILGEIVGRFAGFAVAIWTTKLFSKTVYEKKGINNLFGILGRKKTVINTTPEWLQWLMAAVVGFIVLELINYILTKKLYLKLWDKIFGTNHYFDSESLTHKITNDNETIVQNT